MTEQRHTRPVDVLGIGAGPANLSLAALLTPVSGPSFRLVEGRSAVSWHPGLLLPGATLQVSFLKDLVTPVLPTSPFSFLSFLVEHKQFYRFTAAGYDRASRAEFDRYLRWVASRLPLDDSPFTNELFTPHYARRFFGLDAETRRTLLAAQRLASDGISIELLHQIYRHLYQLEYTTEPGGRSPVVLPERELAAVEPHGDGWRLVLHPVGSGQARTENADVVVLATGYTHQLPDYMQPLVGRIRFDRQHPSVRSDFSLVWDGPEDARIYVQNAARHSHGIADPNLSLLAWRSAVIVNSLLGKDHYDVSEPQPMITWREG